MFLNNIIDINKVLSPGIAFTSKRLLKFAIILFRASLNINIVSNVGKLSIYVMVFTLLTCFGLGYFIGKALGLNWKMSNLISAGTGICGWSAIASIAPVIEAEDTDIFALSATFLFDILMMVAFPIMGRDMSLSDIGLWALDWNSYKWYIKCSSSWLCLFCCSRWFCNHGKTHKDTFNYSSSTNF